MITNRAKKNRVRGSFSPRLGRSYVRYVNYVGNVMYAGYEDFPGTHSFGNGACCVLTRSVVTVVIN